MAPCAAVIYALVTAGPFRHLVGVTVHRWSELLEAKVRRVLWDVDELSMPLEVLSRVLNAVPDQNLGHERADL